MKSTGMVRKIDALGRLVIPKEIRKSLGWENCDPCEFFVDGEKVVVGKYNPGCKFCGTIEKDMKEFGGSLICESCRQEISS